MVGLTYGQTDRQWLTIFTDKLVSRNYQGITGFDFIEMKYCLFELSVVGGTFKIVKYNLYNTWKPAFCLLCNVQVSTTNSCNQLGPKKNNVWFLAPSLHISILQEECRQMEEYAPVSIFCHYAVGKNCKNIIKISKEHNSLEIGKRCHHGAYNVISC